MGLEKRVVPVLQTLQSKSPKNTTLRDTINVLKQAGAEIPTTATEKERIGFVLTYLIDNDPLLQKEPLPLLDFIKSLGLTPDSIIAFMANDAANLNQHFGNAKILKLTDFLNQLNQQAKPTETKPARK